MKRICFYFGLFDGCQEEAKSSLPMDDSARWMCPSCYDKMMSALRAWARGESTDRNQRRARKYFRKHQLPQSVAPGQGV